jgi:hypothetical protein
MCDIRIIYFLNMKKKKIYIFKKKKFSYINELKSTEFFHYSLKIPFIFEKKKNKKIQTYPYQNIA